MILTCLIFELTENIHLIVAPTGDPFIQIKGVPEHSEVQIS
jgi:hypothetical protein